MTIRARDDPEDPALGLAGAVITPSAAPLVLVDGNLGVIAASRSFCEHFEASRMS